MTMLCCYFFYYYHYDALVLMLYNYKLVFGLQRLPSDSPGPRSTAPTGVMVCICVSPKPGK